MLSQTQAGRSNVLFAGQLTAASGKRRSAKWECRLSEKLIGEYLVIPLTSAKMLKSEGYWMNNCCKEYVHQCADLTYCLFSIRSRSGERLATLGLASEQGSWGLDQCFGPSNIDVLEETLVYLDEDEVVQTEWVPTEMYYVAHEVVRLMNSASCGH